MQLGKRTISKLSALFLTAGAVAGCSHMPDADNLNPSLQVNTVTPTKGSGTVTPPPEAKTKAADTEADVPVCGEGWKIASPFQWTCRVKM